MSLPSWGWVILGLWSGPGIYCACALLVQEPIRGLPEEGEPARPLPLRFKILIFPLVLVLLIALWPWVVWVEMDEERRLVKAIKFPGYCIAFVATWPLHLWRVIRESRR